MIKMVTVNHKNLFPSNFFYQPWLIQSHGANWPTQTFIDPTDGTITAKEIAQMQGTMCFGCIDEWFFLWDGQSNECFFLEPNSLSKVHCPPLPKSPDCLMNFSLSSSVNHPDCTIIFIGSEIIKENVVRFQSFFLYCCPNVDKTWTKLPIKGQVLVGETNAIHEGKLYAHSGDNVVVFDVPSLLKGQIDMTTLQPPKTPMHPRTDMSKLSLVESCGHIYLVRINSYSQSPATYIDIHHLDVISNSWLRVYSIGDRAFFLGGRCYATVRASDAGAHNNCIYYSSFMRGIKYERRIYKFCLDDHTMTLILVSGEETKYMSTLCWFVPTRGIQKYSVQSILVLNEATGEENETLAEEKTINDLSRPWDELPIDLIELLLPYLSLVDGVRLPAVCKAWSMISNPFTKTKTWPWLMYHEKASGMCKLIDPFYLKEYRTKIQKTSWGYHTLMFSSKGGWILVLDGDLSVYMINPLLQDLIELPHLEGLKEGFHGATFTSVPTSSHEDCNVFGFSTVKFDSVEIYQWRSGEKKWNVTSFNVHDAPIHFEAANTNPIFFHGELYCLGECGYLWVFNLENKSLRVLDIPAHFYSEDVIVSFRAPQEGYLLELGVELVSVFIYNYSSYGVGVFKLDIMKMEWIGVDDLANWTLFLDHRSSFAMPSPHKSWSNKIFFSAFYSGTSTCATYCMESKRFNMNFTDMKKPFDCVWLEPNLTGNYEA